MFLGLVIAAAQERRVHERRGKPGLGGALEDDEERPIRHPGRVRAGSARQNADGRQPLAVNTASPWPSMAIA